MATQKQLAALAKARAARAEKVKASDLKPSARKEKTISQEVRKATATIVTHTPGPRGGSTKYGYPINDKAHARNADARAAQSRTLTGKEKKEIARKSEKMLGHSTPWTKKTLKK